MSGVSLNSKINQFNQGSQLKAQSNNKLKKSVENLNAELKPLNLGVRFGYNSKVDFLYVQLVDTATNRVIKQEPSNSFLKLKEVIDSIIQDTLRNLHSSSSPSVKISNEWQNVISEINETLKPINENIEFKYINNDLALVEKSTGKVVTTLDEKQIDGLSQHTEDFIDLIGLSFDKTI